MNKEMRVEDAELLRRFVEEEAEEAFAEIVHRHINLVWSAAWRVTGDAELARDVAQSVFVDLARKAPRLPSKILLAGWLYNASCLAAKKVIRTNMRRSNREKQAMELYLPTSAQQEPEDIERLMPVLDGALETLNQADREAVILRFFGRKSLEEVGGHLGVSDDAAQKRLSRAIEKLRRYFGKRGIAVSSSGLALVLGAAGTQAAPAGMAGMVAAAALSGAAVVSAGAASWISSLPTQIMLMKTKVAVSTIVIATVATPLVIQQNTMANIRRENALLADRSANLAVLREQNQKMMTDRALAEELERLRQEHAELLRLAEEIQRLKNSNVSEKLTLHQALLNAQEQLQAAEARTTRLVAEAKAKELHEHTVEALKTIGLAARIYATDNSDRLPLTFDQMTNELSSPLSGNLTLDQFEFVKHGRVISEADPQMFLFREKAPRQLPSGEWIKVYCFADGSVQEHRVKGDDFEKQFEKFERPHIAPAETPARNQ